MYLCVIQWANLNHSPVLAGASPMNAKNRPYATNIPFLFIILSVSLTGMFRVAQATQFTPPDLTGFNLHDERDADGDGDKKNETRLMQYLNSTGDSIVSFTSNERIWAWSLDTRDDETSQRNYVIRDGNCDGIFDEVYGLNDEFHVPDCVK
jgi:hypothetical protein